MRSYVDDSRRKIGPEGTAWCTECQDFLPTTNFHRDPSRWRGLDRLCKEHKKEVRRTRLEVL